MIEIYTDGAYSSSRNTGGWAFIVLRDNEKEYAEFGNVYDTTNNRMEILGCLNALLWLKQKNITEATIFTDSMYVIGTMTKNWKKKKNVDLWIKMFNAVEGLTINWRHIKGHSGNKWNDYCDMLASHGSQIGTQILDTN